MYSMTTEDMLKFCEKGAHEYEEVDVLASMGEGSSTDKKIWLLFECKLCPSRWVKLLKKA